MAGRNGLVLSGQTPYTLRNISLGTLADMGHAGLIVSSAWQRNLRWSLKHQIEFVTAMLRDVPVPQLVLARIRPDERPLGNPEYTIVEGQNRIRTITDFVHNTQSKIQVRACDVLEGSEHIRHKLRFHDLSTAQQLTVKQIQIPVCEIADTVPDEKLREIFRNINKGHPVTTAEIVHSWTHLRLVEYVLNPLELRWQDKMQELRPHWRVRNHALIIIFGRLVAMTDGRDAVFLPSSAAVEKWVAGTETRVFSPGDMRRMDALIGATAAALEDVGVCGPDGAHIFVDLAWIVHACDLHPLENDREMDVLRDVIMMVVRESKAPSDGNIWLARTPYDALLRRQALALYMKRRHDTPIARCAHLLLLDDDEALAVTNEFTASTAPAAHSVRGDGGLSLWSFNGDSDDEPIVHKRQRLHDD